MTPRGKPFVSEPARDTDPVSVLNSETWSAGVEDEPREPVTNSVRPLMRAVSAEREADRDLKSEVCSVKLVVEPMLPVKSSTAPFNIVALMPSEPVRYLPMPFVSETVGDRDPERDLAKPFVSEPDNDIAPVIDL